MVKDRITDDTAKRIHHVAMIMILVTALAALLSGVIISYIPSIHISVLFFLIAIMNVVPDLKVLGGIMTLVAGLTFFIIKLVKLLMGEYSTILKVLLGLIVWGLIPFIAGFLFITSRFINRKE